MLFATLDPTMRALQLTRDQRVILSDTVGFIADLPTELIAAFRATLEEVIEADVIVMVRDIAHPDSEAQRQDVLAVLGQLGLDGPQAAPMIEALNKIDLLPDDQRAALLAQVERRDDQIALSAATGEGVEALRQWIAERLARHGRLLTLDLGHEEGERLAWLYRHGQIIDRVDGEDGVHLAVRLTPENSARFARLAG